MSNNLNDGLKMKKAVWLLFVFLIWMPSVTWSDDDFSDSVKERLKSFQELEENWPEFLENHFKTIPPLTIRGRVLDQNDDPVPGAKVELHWDHFTSDKFYETIIETEFAITGEDGFFSHTVERAESLNLYHPSKKGYEYQRGRGGDFYQARGNVQDAMIKNSVNEPIIIYMRKLNPTTFLLKSGVSHYFKEPNTTLRYTMIPGLLRPIDPDLSKLKKSEQNDLIFIVNKNGDGSYTMHIQPVPEIGGSMQILDDYLYEAPAGGYGQEVALTILPEDGDVHKYLYFTSRKSSVYSRMEMELRVRDEGDLQFHSSTWSNPYGKRNLEWEPELPFDLEEKLEREAEDALQKGALPEESADLTELMEEYAD
jgi:hypothetical protein